jgi:hypothetical protein
MLFHAPDHGRRRVAVAVPAAGRDESDLRPHRPQQRLAGGRGTAVMSDLEHVRPQPRAVARHELLLDGRRCVPGEQRGEGAELEPEHDAQVVGGQGSVVFRQRIEHVEAYAVDLECDIGAAGHPALPVAPGGPEQCDEQLLPGGNAGIDDEPDVERVEQCGRTADMVGIRVREDECVDAAYALAEQERDHAVAPGVGVGRARPGVDHDPAPAGRTDRQCVALSDIDGMDVQRGIADPRQRWRPRQDHQCGRRRGADAEHAAWRADRAAHDDEQCGRREGGEHRRRVEVAVTGGHARGQFRHRIERAQRESGGRTGVDAGERCQQQRAHHCGERGGQQRYCRERPDDADPGGGTEVQRRDRCGQRTGRDAGGDAVAEVARKPERQRFEDRTPPGD